MDQDKIINIVQQATGLRATNSHAPPGADLDVWEALSKSGLKVTPAGAIKPPKPISNRENLSIILEHDPDYETLSYCVHSDKMMPTPWRRSLWILRFAIGTPHQMSSSELAS
jgi:hypothetical protein